MGYWSAEPDGSDFAFDAVGVNILLIKQQMLKDIATVLEKGYPEQGMIASLTCLRLLGERFPKNLRVHFGKKDYQFVKRSFEQWYDKVNGRIPAKYRQDVLAEAHREFSLFEEKIFFSKS